MYICIHIYVCINVYVCIHTYVYKHLHIHTYTCVYIYTHVHIQIQMHVHIHTHIYVYIYIHTHIYIYTYTQTRGLTDYGVKDGNPVVLFLEPNVLRYTHCETCNCRRMRRNCVSPHALKDYSLTYHTDGHGVRTILTPPAPLAAVCTIG